MVGNFGPFFPACGCRGRGVSRLRRGHFSRKTFKNSAGDLCFSENFFPQMRGFGMPLADRQQRSTEQVEQCGINIIYMEDAKP